jgi:hypothetical protein
VAVYETQFTAGENRWKSPPTFLARANVPVSFVVALVTVNSGDVPLPMSKDTVPSGFVVRPSPDGTVDANGASRPLGSTLF